MSPSSSVENTGRKKRKYGCLIWIGVFLALYAACKIYSAHSNRPAGLYQTWFGTPVPKDVTELKGGHKFQLTESSAWLSFKAPPERIAEIVKNRRMRLVEAHPHWVVGSNTRVYTDGKSSGEGPWLWRSEKWHNSISGDQEIYWISSSPENIDFTSGWALYYSPSTQEAFYALETF